MLILGTAQLRAPYGAVRSRNRRATEEGALTLLRAAVDLGVGALDTAPSYDDAEALIGSAGLTLPIHTKIERDRSPRESIAGSLRRLQRSSVEVAYFHDHAIVMDDPHHWIDEATALVGAGVDVLGISVYSGKELRAAVIRGCFGAVQLPMNVLDRRIAPSDVMNARAHGMAIYARSPFLQGVLLRGPSMLPPHLGALAPSVSRIHDIARSAGISPMTLALTWLRDVPGVDGVAVGAENVEQLREITRAWAQPSLDREILRALDNLPRPLTDLIDPRSWPAS